jgi:NADH:ubiquinone oxidoreductase subunit D
LLLAHDRIEITERSVEFLVAPLATAVTVADAVAILGSIDIVMGEVDR